MHFELNCFIQIEVKVFLISLTSEKNWLNTPEFLKLMSALLVRPPILLFTVNPHSEYYGVQKSNHG